MFAAKLKRLVLPIIVVGALGAFASPVQAMCVYNDMDVQGQMTRSVAKVRNAVLKG